MRYMRIEIEISEEEGKRLKEMIEPLERVISVFDHSRKMWPTMLDPTIVIGAVILTAVGAVHVEMSDARDRAHAETLLQLIKSVTSSFPLPKEPQQNEREFEC